MTTNCIPDTLTYKGEEYVPYDYFVLFSSYLEQHQIELPKDMWTFRGYVAKWEIRDNMLLGLDYFFPNQKTVLADWYSGELMICYERKYYESSGDSIYLTFTIDKGHIVKEKYQTQKEWYMSR